MKECEIIAVLIDDASQLALYQAVKYTNVIILQAKRLMLTIKHCNVGYTWILLFVNTTICLNL